LSDIVVYSPRGNTKAALAVATHFAHAIEAKRAQRAAHGQTDLLYYNVFVLCATPEQVAKEMPQVVSRMVDEVVEDGTTLKLASEPEGSRRAHTQGTEGLTGTETHLLAAQGAAGTQEPRRPSRCVRKANTISFAQREKDEMRELTQASEIVTFPLDDPEHILKEFGASSTKTRWDPKRGQVFLGNASDVPISSSSVPSRSGLGADSSRRASVEWDFSANDPAKGFGYDICIECDDMAPFPSQTHMRAAEEHIARLERKWMDRCLKEFNERAAKDPNVNEHEEIPVRPPPSATLVIHLPFPSSVAYCGNSVPPFINWLEALLRPIEGRVTYAALKERERHELEARRWPPNSRSSTPSTPNGGTRGLPRRSSNAATIGHAAGQNYGAYHSHYSTGTYHGQPFGGPSSLPPPSAFPASFLPQQGSAGAYHSNSSYTRMRSTSATHLTSPSPTSPGALHLPARTRPLKVLVHSADGYTESSSLALCLLMALKKASLPEAYLELQIDKRRSFFVYPTEVAPMRRVEARLERERGVVTSGASPGQGTTNRLGRPAAMSMSFAAGSAGGGFFGLQQQVQQSQHHPQTPGGEALSSSAPGAESVFGGGAGVAKRPRASTLPPALARFGGDHQVWFNDPRFDGSFPSRVLPFLYLGNLWVVFLSVLRV
jgi:dual specificity MAP kinase phosphatase